jgi:hypothetical protein
MPLSLFHHDRRAHYRSIAADCPYHHTFGGDSESYGLRFVNVSAPLHLIYRLNQDDPAIPVVLDGLQYLPLVYGFRYAANSNEFIYRAINEFEIEVLSPTEMILEGEFPDPEHLDPFPSEPVAFRQLPFNPAMAEDALYLQAIFGIGELSPTELQRAITLGLSNSSYCDFSRSNLPGSDWTDEQILRNLGRAPFLQGAPAKSCTNPGCTAEIAYHVDERETELSPVVAEIRGQATMRIEARDVRVDTMRVIAIHEPEWGDEVMWGDPFVQMVFEVCACCQCIRVSHQCT